MKTLEVAPVTLGVVTAALGVSARAVRFYEEKGLITPRRGRQNRRVYGAQDRARLETIVRLRSAGLDLIMIREILAFQRQDASAWRSRVRELLIQRRRQLHAEAVQVERTLDWLDPTASQPRRFGVLA
jgi:DNA-binding transcriptional MerR regulator